MDIIKKRIDSLFKELGFDEVTINGNRLYELSGAYYKITYKEEHKSFVIEYAESNYEALKNIFWVDATFFEQGKPTTMTSHIWFKKPDCYRTDGDSAATGPITVIMKDGIMLSWLADKRQVRRLILSPEYRERGNFNFPDSLKAMVENKSSRILGTEYLQGRPVLHIQFSEQVPGLGEMNTHH